MPADEGPSASGPADRVQSTDVAREAELMSTGSAMVEQGFAWGSSGNVSCRTGQDELLISASGASLDRLSAADLVRCAVTDAECSGSGRRPSKELPLHRAAYRARPDVGAVLHGAPFHATLAACSDLEIPDGLFVEAMYYLDRVARVPYHHPGSAALGAAVGELALRANVLLLENHGVVVLGESLDEAFQALQVLEFASRLVLAARAAGVTVQPLPAELASDFRESAVYRPRRAWPKEAER